VRGGGFPAAGGEKVSGFPAAGGERGGGFPAVDGGVSLFGWVVVVFAVVVSAVFAPTAAAAGDTKIDCTEVIAEAAAAIPEVTQDPDADGELVYDHYGCLPAWRWKGITTATTKISAWWDVSGQVLDLIYALLQDLFYGVASVVWRIILFLITFAIDSDRYDDVYDTLQAKVTAYWENLARFLGVPAGGGSYGGLGLWNLLLFLGVIYSFWIWLRPRTGALSYHEVSAWFTGMSAFLSTILPLAFLMYISANSVTAYDGIKRA